MDRVRTWRRLAVWSAAVVALSAALLVALPLAARAQFPINEPFHTDTTTNPHWQLTGSARLTNQGNGWLELTPATGTKAGAAVLDDPYPSDDGIVVNFQYATFGGTGADGFSFFLVDGSFPASTGGSGGGLGYANGTNASGHGIEGGYVGVAFDEYGNFSAQTVLPGGGAGTGPGRKANTIAVRGTQARGFPYLAGVTAPAGTVATGNNTTGVRSVRITILPNSAGTPLLSVFSNTGVGTALRPVITDLRLDAPLPPTFKLGFAASTGGSTNVHEVRDLTVAVPADVSIVKQGPERVRAGGPITYTLLVAGNGPSPIPASSPVVVRDVVPADISGVRWRCEPVHDAVCVAPTSGTGNDVTARVAFPDRGGVGNAQIVITGIVASAATDNTKITDTAAVLLPADREQSGLNGTATDTTTVDPTTEIGSADLEINKTVNNSRPLLGQDITFDVTVTNHGPDPTTLTVVRDQLPAGLDFVSDDAATTGGSYDPLGGVWDVGSLTVGESKTLHITASAQDLVTAVNQVTLAESELPDPTPCPDDCGPAVTVTAAYARLRLTKTVTPAVTVPGGVVTYRLSVTNTGDAPATGVVVTDKLPPQVSYISDDSGGTYHPATGIWDVGDLAIGETRDLDITVRAHATSHNAIVQATSDLPSPDPCLTLPTLAEPEITRRYGCPAPVTETVALPVTG